MRKNNLSNAGICAILIASFAFAVLWQTRPSFKSTHIPHNTLVIPHPGSIPNISTYPPYQQYQQYQPCHPPIPVQPNIPAIPRNIPINIQTSATPGNYESIGFLSTNKSTDQTATILPLYGRPIGRQQWQYYTMSDKYNSIHLPVSVRGKNCSNERGCDEVFNGDVVFVEGYNLPFKVTIYEKDKYQYIPYIPSQSIPRSGPISH